ncbi:hypothetical protein JG687_00015484 [Phytophthora cactorum]|uniref:Uncharacterized protein n=1 Tax=Phytophthora cactorum TaxID=29920 RepID=A0A329SQP5_9STRA|nr:hypothetical protein Pcac1_g10930 [Phytophthora cactorum]KAG2800665.1 hypothetical protein PC112_g20376 [Phytophthora cactorum]KAG2804339.1 hypothetical protein PC111_g18296 [Phytophthora cactorum]KAG2835150.1 hypothetical protein PC113_g20258 [Phytophthora cactorum]KAG2879891.1 hypothetical protein PC114_g22342 [Phytophthora cactorum]
MFPSQKAATTFLQDYNYDIDKRIKLAKNSGGKKAVYKSYDDICGWRVELNRRSFGEKKV